MKERKVYRISYEGAGETRILSSGLVLRLLTKYKGKKRVFAAAKELFSDEELEYLKRVLNVNEAFKDSLREDGEKDLCTRDGVCRILGRQMEKIRLNGEKCFSSVRYREREKDFLLEYSEDMRKTDLRDALLLDCADCLQNL